MINKSAGYLKRDSAVFFVYSEHMFDNKCYNN